MGQGMADYAKKVSDRFLEGDGGRAGLFFLIWSRVLCSSKVIF